MKDLIIIGAGPAGLTAGMYASRARLDTVLIEKGIAGGQVITTEWIENYPGFDEGISGPDLSLKMKLHAVKFGLDITHAEVSKFAINGKVKEITLDNGDTLETKALIIATGATSKKLGIPGENEFRGRGVSYCATCDGAFFRDKKLAVIGGGNTSVEESIFLTRFASKLYIIHRRDKLRADKVIQERAFTNPRIEFKWHSIPIKINGHDTVTSVTLKNVISDEVTDIAVDGVFIFIGWNPNTELFKNIVQLDEMGYVIVNDRMETSVPGVFAAGDVNNRFLNQIATAVGDGAVAAVAAEKYIEEHFH
jgi:thioredoxin reductase (NADPH)